MNKKMIVYILGKMMGVEGLLLLIPALVSLIYHEKSVISFLIVAAILLVIYMVFGRKLPASKQIYGKEGFVIVGLAWILWSAFGALPFVISGSIPHYVDALFETISGFTTTDPVCKASPEGNSHWQSLDICQDCRSGCSETGNCLKKCINIIWNTSRNHKRKRSECGP